MTAREVVPPLSSPNEMIEVAIAEDGRTIFLWFYPATGEEWLQTYTLGAPPGTQAKAPHRVL